MNSDNTEKVKLKRLKKFNSSHHPDTNIINTEQISLQISFYSHKYREERWGDILL